MWAVRRAARAVLALPRPLVEHSRARTLEHVEVTEELGVEHQGVRLFAVLVTFRRPEGLRSSLEAVRSQGRALDGLVVVDNSPAEESRAIVEALAPDARYVPASENLGPAGGLSLGMDLLLEDAADDDWILTLDDNDPASDSNLFAALLDFAVTMSASDDRLGAVGAEGMRFDRRRGRVVWVADDELAGPVAVDSVGGRNFPLYSAGVLRRVGTMRRDLFFGFEELELGLRLRDAGYQIYASGELWYQRRAKQGLLARSFRPALSLGRVTWRRYYSLRNLVRILLDCGAIRGALSVTVVVGLAKPLANVVRKPRRAAHHLWLNVRACRDAWTGRMGRTIEPPS